MKIVTIQGVDIALCDETLPVLTGEQAALEFIMNVSYETGCTRIALRKEAIAEDFFILSTGLAGKILQKFANYRIKLAIIGDFSGYTSKPLKDFMYECNHGRDIFFVPSEQDALDRLATAL